MATDLAQFTEGILARKTAELERVLTEKKAEADRRLAAASDTIAANETAAKAKLDASFALQDSAVHQALENKKRNRLLEARQTALKGLFETAYEAMLAWDDATFNGFLNQVLASLPKDTSYRVILGHLSQRELVLPEGFVLASETIPNQAGFVLETEGIRYNYLFQELLADMAPDMMGMLSQQLDR